jgi:hypothetical protein
MKRAIVFTDAMFYLLAFTGCAESPFATNQPLPPSGPPVSVFHIYLCIGQSNMAGRAAIEAEDNRPIGDNVLLYNAAGKWEKAQPGLRGGTVNVNDLEGLNRYSNVRKTGSDKSSRQGLNPAFYFADLMKDKVPAGVTIGLVVNARGGTSLAQWSKGFSGANDFNLYEKTLERVQAAINSGGVLKGIIWHQGESDGGNLNYVSELQTFAATMRADLGVNAADVPFIAGEIPKYLSYQKTFNDRMPSFTSTELNTDYVKVPSHLKSIGDNTHWNSAAQRVVGKLYGQMMLKMAYNVDVEVDVDDPGTDPDPDDDDEFEKITLEGTKITASDTDGNNSPSKTADGDTSNGDGKRWLGVLKPDGPAWLKIDLGELKHVGYIDIYFFKQNLAGDNTWKPHTYKIQYAVTGAGADEDFEDVFEETRTSLPNQAYNRETINKDARWLKIIITDSAKPNGSNKWVSINEVEVYGRSID